MPDVQRTLGVVSHQKRNRDGEEEAVMPSQTPYCKRIASRSRDPSSTGVKLAKFSSALVCGPKVDSRNRHLAFSMIREAEEAEEA
ncbi:hypothetical protein G7Y89_g13388 [Cudoniella acicularis]|uniref:Uncharacterized protein n=1 Tax=Cudoniella acicularis TaxID=354080 RepID=A0A8H4R9G0_9HELO|nr:hypothetical protein G7Y89_g13388 [Cudoniella acicularis]